MSGARVEDLGSIMRDCPFHRLLGIEMLWHDAEARKVRIVLTPGAELMRSDTGEGLHGGVIATMIDVAAVLAMRIAAQSGGMTAALSVDYLRPVAGGRVEAEARIIRAGRTTAIADVELYDGAALAAIGRVRLAVGRKMG